MARSKRGRNLKDWKTNRADPGVGKLRIIGGTYRGRLIEYSGDPVTRPMKDNIREALFNLIGGWVPGKVIIDLFAGTGAIGLESLSRGATAAIFVERHFPTVRIIEQNVASIAEDIADKSQVHASDTFFWVRRFVERDDRPSEPWMVFCCPPYDFFVDREEEVLAMLKSLIDLAPPQSIFIVEADTRFDQTVLPNLSETSQVKCEEDDRPEWQVRRYAPAIVSVLKIPEA